MRANAALASRPAARTAISLASLMPIRRIATVTPWGSPRSGSRFRFFRCLADEGSR